MIASLDEAFEDVVRRLTQAADDRSVPMHTPVVATADADARVMVLRAFDNATWSLRLHTDVRAPKAAIIAENPALGLLFYDKPASVQIRCRGIARIEQAGALADEAWASSDNYARRCYLGAAPGELSENPTSGLPEWIEGEKPTEDQLASARENFAVLLVELQEIDWFSLAHTGHRRALFTRSGDEWEGRWIAP